MKRLIACILVVGMALLMSGCGGGGSGSNGSASSTTARQTGQATFTIAWPGSGKQTAAKLTPAKPASRVSRVIPDSVASIRITITNGSVIVGDKLFPRPSQGGQTSAAISGLPAGVPLTATVYAFPNAAGTGVPVAQASIAITIVANQNTQAPTITLDSAINHVDVTPGTLLAAGQSVTLSGGQPLSLTVGQTLPLVATPRDSSNNVVLIAPGNLTWASNNAAVAIDPASGVITAKQPGAANIIATVKVADGDPGVASPAFPVVVHVNIAFNPTAVVMTIGQSVTFSATLTPAGSGGVTYSVQEGNAGGSVNPTTGAYTAPGTAGTYHLIATSQADPTQSATATIVAQEAVHAVVTSSLRFATITPQSTITLAASVQGKTNTGVTWSIQEGAAGGTLTADASGTETYTASSNPGIYHIVATSQADPSQAAVSTIVVQFAPAAIYSTLSAATLAPQTNVTLRAIVTNQTNSGVTYTIQEGSAGGTLTANGDGTETYTAPGTAGTYHIVATSQANPALVAVSTITVLGQAGAAIHPNLTAAIVFPQSALTLRTIVTGYANTGVTYTIQEGATGGTLTANGDGTETYTSPNTAGTYHIMAVSQADNTLVAVIPISVTGSQSAVIIIPPAVTLTLQQTTSFCAAVANMINNTVTWSIQEGASGGTLFGQTGNTTLYTAPATPGTYHLIATSQANGALQATATITVKAGALNVTVN